MKQDRCSCAVFMYFIEPQLTEYENTSFLVEVNSKILISKCHCVFWTFTFLKSRKLPMYPLIFSFSQDPYVSSLFETADVSVMAN